jgi:hypothetical protein
MRLLVLASLFVATLFAAPGLPEPRTLHLAVRPQPGTERILTRDEFSVRINGRPAPVVSVKSPRDSQIILLVLDLAGDLNDAQAAKDALVAELATLPDSTLIALLRAQDGPTVLVDPTSDRAKISDAIQASPVTGKAGLLNSLVDIQTLADNVSRASNVRIATLYVTDSNVGNYREDFANPVINSSDSHDLSRRFPGALIAEKIGKLESEIAARETTLYIAHLRYSASTLSAAYQAGLKRLADSTGGWSAFCASTAEIPDAIHEAFAAITAEYTLTVALPPKLPAALQIHVAAADQNLSWRSRLMLKPAAKH